FQSSDCARVRLKLWFVAHPTYVRIGMLTLTIGRNRTVLSGCGLQHSTTKLAGAITPWGPAHTLISVESQTWDRYDCHRSGPFCCPLAARWHHPACAAPCSLLHSVNTPKF